MALNQRPGPRRVTVLGSTGSVGKSTVSLLEAAAEDTFDVVALVAGRDWQGLAAQARRLRARHAVLADASQYQALKEALAGTGTEVAAGPEAVVAVAGLPADWTMAAIVGAAGLPATMAALARGGIMAIANKESLVCAGEPVLAAARAGGATILPVDSEHNAIFQALDMRDPSAIAKIILTASGGPCRTMTLGEMA
ncbi:MAG: 1-deoxy-D-xylulose-5-phosphate reductoisomerase, partial [Roseomonas sp.]|nr:1-deoxy-D-xylulose-5-phosphate reductoisomerase [Roseomonas sp.]